MSWQDIDNHQRNLEKKHHLNLNENRKIYSLIYSVFNTQNGKKLINKWKEIYLCAPVAPICQEDKYSRYREGQNSFIRYIIASIKEHEILISEVKNE